MLLRFQRQIGKLPLKMSLFLDSFHDGDDDDDDDADELLLWYGWPMKGV